MAAGGGQQAERPAALFRATGGLNVPASTSPRGRRRLSAPWPFGEVALFDDHLEIRSRLGGATVDLPLDVDTTAAILPRVPSWSGVYFSAGRRNQEFVRALQEAGVRFTARPSLREMGRTVGANAGAEQRTPAARTLIWTLRAALLVAVAALLLNDW